MKVTGNVKYIPAGVTQYVVDGNDGEINVDTSLSAITIILPNIINSGYTNTDKGFIINDISNNAGTNNITIAASNNTVNSQSSVLISVNGGTAKCSVASMNEWFAITEPTSSNAYTASNGVALVGNDFQLASHLISQFTNDAGYLTSSATTDLDPVISQTNTVPGAPVLGDRYLAGTIPGAPWTANSIEEWDGVSWITTAPVLDDVVFVTSTLSTLRYNGSAWVAYAGTAVLNQGNTTGSTLVIGTNTSQALAFKTNNVETARVVSGGSWGFGTITPSAKVTVKGQGATSATVAFDVRNSSNTLMLSVRNNGFTGIGTATPLAKLYILQDTVSTGQKGLSVNFNTIGEVFYIDDNGILMHTANAGATFKGSNGLVNIISNGGTSPTLYFKYNNGSSDSGLLYGSSASMFLQSPLFGIGNTNFTPSASVHIQGVDATSSNFTLKVDNSASVPLLYVRNDGNIGINESSPLTKLDVSGSMRVYNGGMRVGTVGIGTYSFWTNLINEISTNFNNTSAHLILQYSEGGNVGINTNAPTAKLQVVGLVSYADNAAAVTAGLTVGAMYIRTGHGLDIVV